MGASMVTLTNNLTLRDCKLDADCYTASLIPAQLAITTDDAKDSTCCMYFGVTAAASGSSSEVSLGNIFLAAEALKGLPTKVGEATKYCNWAYPITVAAIKLVTTGANNNYAYPAAAGGVGFSTYCDGGAATLAAVTASIAVATISLY